MKVLCLVRTTWTDSTPDEQELWMDLEPISRTSRKIVKVIPLIDHLHNDKENGQPMPHYHIDSRFYKGGNLHYTDLRVYPHELKSNEKLEYRELVQFREKHDLVTATSVRLISKSKLKHNCIHKGKCPHRGYDLTGVQPDKDGILTCPLHSLRFDTKNKNKLIQDAV